MTAGQDAGRSVALVTGAGAVGRAIAEGIAARPGHEVVLVCRDEAKARATAATIRQHTGNQHPRFELAES